MLEAAILVVFPLCMAMAAMTDILSMTIPNRVSLLLAASYFILAPVAGLDFLTIGWSVIAAFCVFAVCFALFALNVMGGGDAKILTASALWFGFGFDLVEYLTLVGYLGGVLTIIILILRTQVMLYIVNALPIPLHLTDSKAGVPYGVAISAAALLNFPETKIFILALG
jgi:prepilin peptidase CpaA